MAGGYRREVGSGGGSVAGWDRISGGRQPAAEARRRLAPAGPVDGGWRLGVRRRGKAEEAETLL